MKNLLISALMLSAGSLHAADVYMIDQNGGTTRVEVDWSLQGSCVTAVLPGEHRYLLVIDPTSDSWGSELFDADPQAWTEVHAHVDQSGEPLTHRDGFPSVVGFDSAPGSIDATLASKGGAITLVIQGESKDAFTVSLHGTRERDRYDFNRDDVIDHADFALAIESTTENEVSKKYTLVSYDECCVVAEMLLSPSHERGVETAANLALSTPRMHAGELAPAIPVCEALLERITDGWNRYAGR